MGSNENEQIEPEDLDDQKHPWAERRGAPAESRPPRKKARYSGSVAGYPEIEALKDFLPLEVLDVARAFGKNFFIGFTWQLLLQAFPLLLKGKVRQLKNLMSPENFVGFCQRGLMLGSWVVQFRLLMKLFVKNGNGQKFQKGSPQFINQCNKVGFCGFLSGLSSMYTVGGLHWSMCLYFACRSLRAVLEVGVIEHWFPEWLEKMPTWLLFAIICGPTASHPLLYKAQYVPKGYFDFVGAACVQSIGQINYMFPNSLEKIIPCQPHYHQGPCFQNALKTLRHSLTYLMKFYMVFYSVFRVLLRSPKQLLRSPINTLKAIIRNAIGSTLFVSCVGWGACLLPCVYRPFVTRMTPLNVVPWSCFTALGLYFEGPSRQAELFVYNISCTIEGFVNYYFKYNVRTYPAPPTPKFLEQIVGPLLFGIASAGWVWARHRSPDTMKTTEKKILNHVLPLEPKFVRFDESCSKPHVINGNPRADIIEDGIIERPHIPKKASRNEGLHLLELFASSVAATLI